MSENKNAIEMRGVDIGAMRDPAFKVVENVNWSVATGEFWVVAGQQRSGKSDFAMLAGGLMSPVQGCYELFGNKMPVFDEERLAERLRLGFVFEGGQLFHHLTVAENVALPLGYHERAPHEAMERAVGELLELTELNSFAGIMPANLGRSWIKRAGLARALALKPELLLLDNPLGGLDARHSQWWLRFLDELWRGHKWFGNKPMTIIATTDDLRPWRNNVRRFALLKEMNFIQLGSWNEVLSANEPLVKELLAAPVDPAA